MQLYMRRIRQKIEDDTAIWSMPQRISTSMSAQKAVLRRYAKSATCGPCIEYTFNCSSDDELGGERRKPDKILHDSVGKTWFTAAKMQ